MANAANIYNVPTIPNLLRHNTVSETVSVVRVTHWPSAGYVVV
jgi:hypothetical protein